MKNKYGELFKTSVDTYFANVPVLTRWTFECSKIRKWVELNLEGRVMNACCGKCELSHDEGIVRNDIDGEVDADTHLDAAELSSQFDRNSFQTVVFDPPWSMYQANLRYKGNHVGIEEYTDINLDDLPLEVPRDKNQLGHARLAKENFDYLLKKGGKVIELSMNGSCMPNRMGYKQEERVLFNQLGKNKMVVGSIDVKNSEEGP